MEIGGSRVERVLSWLQTALRLKEPAGRLDFLTPYLVGIVDVLQNGWSIGDFVRDTTSVGAGVAAGSVTIFTNGADEASLIIGIEIQHTAGGAACSSAFSVLPVTVGGGAYGILKRDTAIATADFTAQVIAGLPTHCLYVPPGCALRVAHSATVALEAIDWVVFRLRVPAGIKPF